MAKAITHTSEGVQPSAGSWFLLVVSVMTLTVLAISVPHLIGSEGWFAGARAGEKFLYVALIAYLGASVLYGSSVALRRADLLQGAVLFSRAGLLLHTIAILARWTSSGHAPLSDIYEMVLVFSWAVVALQRAPVGRAGLAVLAAVLAAWAPVERAVLAGLGECSLFSIRLMASSTSSRRRLVSSLPL